MINPDDIVLEKTKVKIIDKKTSDVVACDYVRRVKDSFCDKQLKEKIMVSFDSKFFFPVNNNQAFNVLLADQNEKIVVLNENKLIQNYQISHWRDYTFEELSHSISRPIWRDFSIDECDKEVYDLVHILNSIDGVDTETSCCGHGCTPLFITLRFTTIEAQRRILSVLYNDEFKKLFELTTHKILSLNKNEGVNFMLKTKDKIKGKKAYVAAAQLAEALKQYDEKNTYTTMGTVQPQMRILFSKWPFLRHRRNKNQEY